jgi:hypothetical protein
MAHAHAVDTRPSIPLPLPPIRRPGDEARVKFNMKLTAVYACVYILLYFLRVVLYSLL